MIVVYGATGYTGRQTAEALVERGHPVVLAGRTRSRLEALAERFGGSISVEVAELDDHAALTRLAEGASVVVNCVGPFVHSCRPVAEAAIAGHAHYVDISAEQLGTHWCYGSGDVRARAADVALLPSFAFYSALADVLADRACAGLGPITEMQVAYWIDDWQPIGTTVTSRFEGMSRGWFDHEDGSTVTRRRFARTTYVDFPSPVGRQRVGPYPTSDVFTIPRHIDVDRLTTRLTTSTLAPPGLGRFVPAAATVAGFLMRTPARPVLERGLAALWRASASGTAGSDPTRFMVVVDVRGKAGTARHWLQGRGIYDITAPLAVEAAVRAHEHGFGPTGVVAPAQVLDLDHLLTALSAFDLDHGTTEGHP